MGGMRCRVETGKGGEKTLEVSDKRLQLLIVLLLYGFLCVSI